MFSVRSRRGLEAESVFVSEGHILVLLPNKCIERTAGKRCLPVHSGLLPPSAAHARRYAAWRPSAAKPPDT